MKQRALKRVMVGAAAATMMAFGAVADDAYALVNKENGYSYIQINQNLDSFSFKSDFKSIGNSGKVGYVVYSQDLSDDQLAEYIRNHAGNAQFGKKIDGGLVDLGSLNAGDRVGFYLERNNGDTVYETLFVEKHGTDYLEFDKNHSSSSKDEWMSIEDVKAVAHTSGAPLPGVLAVLLVGGLGAGAMKLRKRHA